ncbi:class II aldolase/adducin family protein [Pseudomonas sp. zfem002]|uniref:class II aldolase/adducin family protein n=1 Tax=Pseudomonas sp. zfem002 TaxID=3078197 RepID=UPI002928B4BB|nr:class II aldolase/adducin family protein [Pseudomonas sp. zfem002]MDU9394695.1 class II aldolase/adducin family protein [Pseudomonas sp. zfem002]
MTRQTPPADLLLLAQQFEQDVASAHQLLQRHQALSANQAGNLSLRLPGQERLLIAAFNGPDAGRTAVLDFDLEQSQGRLNDNLREVAALHVAIYRQRPQVRSVIHTHSPYLSAFAIAGRPLRAHASQLLGVLDEDQEIPLTAWGPRYAPEPVIAALQAHPRAPATLLANHGPFAWSERDALAATRLLINLEESAHLTWLAAQLGTPQPFPAGAAERSRQGWVAS